MASMKVSLVLLLVCSLFLEGSLADIICENLPQNACAFSISSSGQRCLLENSIADDGKVDYICKTSDVTVGNIKAEYLETDECVKACGVDRNAVGMSSDALLEPAFTNKLCSQACYLNCPNIVDLYFNLAAGEGVYLPDMCEMQRSGSRRDMAELSDVAAAPTADGVIPRRGMAELSSSGALAPGPVSDEEMIPRRGMTELLSSGAVAPGPVSDEEKIPRRGMTELLSSGAADAVAPGPIAADGAAEEEMIPRRGMTELLSSGAVEYDTVSSGDLDNADAPAPSPFFF